MNTLSKSICVPILSLLLLAPAFGGDSEADRGYSGVHRSVLVKKLRAALGHYRDVQLAMAAGYEPGACVSGPNGGAMGIHFVNPALLDGAAPVLEQPEALIYEPQANGRLRLVAAEYITLAGPAALEGHLLNYVGSGNRYGLPEFWEIHVWAWKKNPSGTFADWNPWVTCDYFSL